VSAFFDAIGLAAFPLLDFALLALLGASVGIIAGRSILKMFFSKGENVGWVDFLDWVNPSLNFITSLFPGDARVVAQPEIERVKIVLLGPAGVGKSAICSRYTLKSYYENYTPSIGGKLHRYCVSYIKSLELMIWDTAGDKRYQNLVGCYIGGKHSNKNILSVDLIVLVFDLTNSKSLNKLNFFYQASLAALQTQERSLQFKDKGYVPAKFILVGNKADCTPEERKVTKEMMEKWAKDRGNMPCLEVSAKTGEGVEAIFVAADDRLQLSSNARKSLLL
jgi:small GTP-binding protein